MHENISYTYRSLQYLFDVFAVQIGRCNVITFCIDPVKPISNEVDSDAIGPLYHRSPN